MKFHPSKNYLYCSGNLGALYIFDLSLGICIDKIGVSEFAIKDMDFALGGQFIVIVLQTGYAGIFHTTKKFEFIC